MEHAESTTDTRSPMSAHAAALFRLAMRDSFIEQVAKHMAFVAWLDAGCTGLPDWDGISPNVQEAYRVQARKACGLLDNGARLSIMKAAIDCTLNWMNAPGGSMPDLPDLLLHCLMDFDHLAEKESGRG